MLTHPSGGQHKSMVIRDVCPQCKSPKSKKNGHIHNGKQNHQCKDCGRQFVDCFEQYLVPDETRSLIERLLLERLSLRGICRSVGVGLKWLLEFIVTQFEALPDHLNVEPITSNADVVIQRLEVEADEMASCVQKKVNKQWIWLAMDAKSRQIIGFHVGIAVAKVPGSCGPTFRRFIVNRRRFIRTSMWSMSVSFPLHSTNPLVNWPEKRTTSSASTTRSDNACLAWSAVRCRFPRSWPITSTRSSILFATIT